MWRTLKNPGSCHECRRRRLKCDELRPFCLKCEKNGRICTGYTDWSQLPIRDMTAWTVKRFQTVDSTPKNGHEEQVIRSRKRVHIPSRSKSWQANSCLRSGLPLSDSSLATIIHNPPISIEDQAIAYLRTEFVDQSILALDPGYCDILRHILRLDKIDHCLSACLTAAALAAFSTRPNCMRVEVKAQKAYTSALATMNMAIQRSNAADDNQLLGSVLLLAFFEIFRCSQLTAYYNHIFGAASMVKARKTPAASDHWATQLYSLVKNELCRLSLLGFAKPTDDDLALWMWWRENVNLVTCNPNDPADRKISESNLSYHARSMIDFVMSKNTIVEIVNNYGFPKDARSAQHFITSCLTGMKSIVDKFTELETAAFVTLGSRPMRFLPPVQRDTIFRDAYPRSPILIYKTMGHAIFHITINVARVSCMTHLMTLVSGLEFETGVENMPAYQAMLYQTQDDLETIVGSAPFICGWTADGTHVFPNAFDAIHGHPQSHSTGFATTFIAWSWVALETNPLATGEQKRYLNHMARYLADIRRVRQAQALLDVSAQDTTKDSLARWYQKSLK